jgi:PAS domain S-box-containing protein
MIALWNWKRSIRGKVSAIIMLACTMVLLLATIGFVTADLLDEYRDLDHNLSTLAEVIGSNSVAALTFGDQKTAGEVLAALRTTPSVISGCLYTKEGVPFAAYSSGPAAHSIPPVSGPDRITRRDGYVELFRSIRFEGELVGTVYVKSDLRGLRERFKQYEWLVTAIVLASLFVALVLSSQLQRVISEPIVELADVARNVSRRKDYTLRAKPRTSAASDEIGQLVTGFNDMLVEIERRDQGLLLNRAQLEEEVARRTSQLREANEGLVIARDTAEAEAEINMQLRRKNELILNSMADGVHLIDLTGKITLENPAAARMLGWETDALIGRPAHETIHHSKSPGVVYAKDECPIYATLRDGVLRQVHDEFFWRKDGTSFPVDYLAAPMLDGKGGVIGVVVTFRDVTERRAVDRMKDEFVSTVSHELRTPLTSLRGALGLLSSGMLGKIADKGQRMLEIAVTNTDRLVRLINDILDLERMESGRVEISRRSSYANDLMSQAVDGVQSMADEAGVLIEIEPIEATLWVDSDMILQTLTNLLSNAIKFSPAGSTVTLSGEGGGAQFTFRVSDHGRGIPHDKLESIFERFKQVDASDSRDKGGSGLGLAICRSIVNAHGGKIWGESETGKGTVFQFTIPLRQSDGVAPASDPVRTLLLCEEDASAMQLVVKMLEAEGFRVVSVGSADEVARRAADIRPDAIILDLASTNGNGWRLVAALKASAVTREIPIVVAAAQPPDSCERYADGIESWVHKPIQHDELVHAVDAACTIPSVLIVEDDLDLARVMATSLEMRGLRTLHATNGKEAVALCREHAPSLIVLDLILPDMDGFAVVDFLRKESALRSVPLLVHSALEVAAADQTRLTLGPTEFLTKSRGGLKDFDSQVVHLLKTVTTPREENQHAA